MTIGRVALEKKASDVVVLEVAHLTSIAEFFVFCSGNSERQVKAITNAVQNELWKNFSAKATVEGESSASWILLDYRDIIVHVFQEDIRAYYGIENLWRDAKQIPQSEFDTIPPGSFLFGSSRQTAVFNRAS